MQRRLEPYQDYAPSSTISHDLKHRVNASLFVMTLFPLFLKHVTEGELVMNKTDHLAQRDSKGCFAFCQDSRIIPCSLISPPLPLYFKSPSIHHSVDRIYIRLTSYTTLITSRDSKLELQYLRRRYAGFFDFATRPLASFYCSFCRPSWTS